MKCLYKNLYANEIITLSHDHIPVLSVNQQVPSSVKHPLLHFYYCSANHNKQFSSAATIADSLLTHFKILQDVPKQFYFLVHHFLSPVINFCFSNTVFCNGTKIFLEVQVL